MEIAYTNRRPAECVTYRYEPSLEALARDSDILVIAASGGASTKALVNRAVIDALGPEDPINVARGSVVDEAELVEALLEGRLGGAGLDVFADEPNVPTALFGLQNVVLIPHSGSATIETRTAMGELVVQNMAAHFSGREPPTAVV